MSRKVMTVLGVAAVAVVALVVWQRSKLRSQMAAMREAGYDPPPPPTTSALVAQSFQGLVSSVTNWAAQWANEGARRVGGTVVQAMPVPLSSKEPTSANADPRHQNLVNRAQAWN